jgi:hypothetical protein
METSKYPRALANVETTSRRQHDLEKIKADTKDIALLQKKGTFTFANAYPYIFDGLSFLCTNFAMAQWKDNKGRIRNVIERQDNDTETHYRAIIKVDSFMDMALNGHDEYRHNFLNQLYKLAAHPEKKVLPFIEGYKILTEPVRIDLTLEDGSKLSEAEKARLSNLYDNSGKGERINGRVELIMIEFYKPLFESLFQTNSKGELGKNYIQVPKALTAETKATIEKLRLTGFFKNTDLEAEKVPMYESDARAIFLYMAQHDNKQGEHITINAIEFAESCFPGDVKILHRAWADPETGETREADEKYISKADGYKIRTKIKKTIVTFKQMGKFGKMDGGQFIPLELDETKVQYDHAAKEYRIKVLRPKNQGYPVFDPKDLEEFEKAILRGEIPF